MRRKTKERIAGTFLIWTASAGFIAADWADVPWSGFTVGAKIAVTSAIYLAAGFLTAIIWAN